MNQFREYLIREEKEHLTVEKYIRDTEHFLRWLGAQSLTKERALAYKQYLMEGYAFSSVNSMLSSLNCYLEYLGRSDCRVKTIRQQRSTFLEESRELTKEEYTRLLQAARGKPRLCLLMQTICATGIRVSEHRFITVEAARAGYAQVRMKGKHRIVFIPKKLCGELLKFARKQRIRSGSIFITASGRPLDRCNIWAEMKKLCRTAGVSREKVFPHNLRHLFARTYYALEKDVVRLADILGHSNVNTTRIYTMESGQSYRARMDRLELMLIT